MYTLASYNLLPKLYILPYKEKKIEKIYFTIGEVAKKFGVATSLIRFWESEFDTIRPKKSSNGNRQYTRDDINAIQLIYNLVKERGHTLFGAKEIIKNDFSSTKNKVKLVNSLVEIKKFLEEIKSQNGFKTTETE